MSINSHERVLLKGIRQNCEGIRENLAAMQAALEKMKCACDRVINYRSPHNSRIPMVFDEYTDDIAPVFDEYPDENSLPVFDSESPTWDEDPVGSVSIDDEGDEFPRWDEDSEIELANLDGGSNDKWWDLPIWDDELEISPSEELVELPSCDVPVETIPSLIQVVESIEELVVADQFQDLFPVASSDIFSKVMSHIFIPKAVPEVSVHEVMSSSVVNKSMDGSVETVIAVDVANIQYLCHGYSNYCIPHNTSFSVMSLWCFDPGISYMELLFFGFARNLHMLHGEVQSLTIVHSGLQNMCSLLAYTGTSISRVRSIYTRESNINGGQGPVKYISVLRLLSIGVVKLNKATEMYGLQIKFFRFAATIQDDQDAAITIPWTDIIVSNVACIILLVSGNLQSEMVTSFAKLLLFEADPAQEGSHVESLVMCVKCFSPKIIWQVLSHSIPVMALNIKSSGFSQFKSCLLGCLRLLSLRIINSEVVRTTCRLVDSLVKDAYSLHSQVQWHHVHLSNIGLYDLRSIDTVKVVLHGVEFAIVHAMTVRTSCFCPEFLSNCAEVQLYSTTLFDFVVSALNHIIQLQAGYVDDVVCEAYLSDTHFNSCNIYSQVVHDCWPMRFRRAHSGAGVLEQHVAVLVRASRHITVTARGGSEYQVSLPSINMLTSFLTDHGVYCYWSLKVLKHFTKHQASLTMIFRVNKDGRSSTTHDNFFASLELSQADLLKNSLKMLDTNIFTKVTSKMGCCLYMGYHDLCFSVGVCAICLTTLEVPSMFSSGCMCVSAVQEFELIDSAVRSGAQATAALLSRFAEYWLSGNITSMTNISCGTLYDILYGRISSKQRLRLFEKCFRKIGCLFYMCSIHIFLTMLIQSYLNCPFIFTAGPYQLIVAVECVTAFTLENAVYGLYSAHCFIKATSSIGVYPRFFVSVGSLCFANNRHSQIRMSRVDTLILDIPCWTSGHLADKFTHFPNHVKFVHVLYVRVVQFSIGCSFRQCLPTILAGVMCNLEDLLEIDSAVSSGAPIHIQSSGHFCAIFFWAIYDWDPSIIHIYKSKHCWFSTPPTSVKWLASTLNCTVPEEWVSKLNCSTNWSVGNEVEAQTDEGHISQYHEECSGWCIFKSN